LTVKPPEVADDMCVAIETDVDIVTARMRGRALALRLGFSSPTATLIATAISELSRNILLYAGHGEVLISAVERARRSGIAIVARDDGPGIPDISRAVLDGYSTSGRLGLGIPGVRRLMDEFDIDTRLGAGTTVRVVKWIE
jgi:serine/threonine-protein kinase RsbT